MMSCSIYHLWDTCPFFKRVAAFFNYGYFGCFIFWALAHSLSIYDCLNLNVDSWWYRFCIMLWIFLSDQAIYVQIFDTICQTGILVSQWTICLQQLPFTCMSMRFKGDPSCIGHLYKSESKYFGCEALVPVFKELRYDFEHPSWL